MLVSVGGTIVERSAAFSLVGQIFVDPVTNICGHSACANLKVRHFLCTVAQTWALRSDLLAAVSRLERVEQVCIRMPEDV